MEGKLYTKDEVIHLMKLSIKRGDDLRCEVDRIAIGFAPKDDTFVNDLTNPEPWIEETLK